MIVTWVYEPKNKFEYYYGTIEGSKVTAQIGESTNLGNYVWLIFHEDIGCNISGGESVTLEQAKSDVNDWINQWVKQ